MFTSPVTRLPAAAPVLIGPAGVCKIVRWTISNDNCVHACNDAASKNGRRPGPVIRRAWDRIA
jgi:hypothetical protein